MSIKSIKTGFTGISALAGNPAYGDFESIATYAVTSGTTANIVFSNIPSNFQHLQVRGIMRTDRAVTYTNSSFRFNSDTGSNYAWHYINGSGSGTPAVGGSGSTSVMYGNIVGASSTASCFQGFILDVLDYSNSNKNKTIRLLDGYDANGSGQMALWSGHWRNTSVVTSITIFVDGFNLIANSHIALYGIR